MSSNFKNQIPLRKFKHSAPVDEIVIKRLEDLGFVLEEKEFSFGESNFSSRVDFIFRRGRKKYAIEVKQSRKIQLVLSHLLPSAYSGAFRTPIPEQSGHLFHLIPDTHSCPFRTL
jgi:hypothetical protein